MREVNNNTVMGSGNVNFQNVQAKEDVKPEQKVEVQETTDLGKMPSEVIGRSQVQKNDSDIIFAIKNPEQVEKLNEFCEKLENMGYSYEQACSIAGAAAEEFLGA